MVGEVGCGKIHLFILASGPGLSWSLLLFFFAVVDPALTPGVSGVLADPLRIGFPISVVLDEGRPTLRNSLMRLKAGCLFFLRWSCLGFLEVCLLMWFIVKRLLLVDWMVGVGGNLRCCLFLGLIPLHMVGPLPWLLGYALSLFGWFLSLLSRWIFMGGSGFSVPCLFLMLYMVLRLLFFAGTSMRKLRAAILGVAWSCRQPFADIGAVLSLLDGPSGCDPAFFGFIVCWAVLLRVVLVMVLLICLECG